MSEWRPKRFWKSAEAKPVDGGFTVQLDGKPIRTPGKNPIAVPTLALAEAIAQEWNAQTDLLRPETMPFTRSANTAIDRIGQHFDAVVDDLAGYGASDLLSYRAEGPEELIARQAEGWDPLLAWATERFGAPLRVTSGIIPVSQAAQSLEALAARVRAMTPFELTAFYDLVAISGSLVLALAVAESRLEPEEAWRLSRLDETWQNEHWGEDSEAAKAEAFKRQDFLSAARFFRACR